MKVLYLASRTPTVESLTLEVEITGVQRRLRADVADPAQFIFLPDIRLEDVPLEITRHKPDVLHISVHGDDAGLHFASADNRMLALSADQLAAFLPRDKPPKLVFLNACESHLTAKRLAELGFVAIGTEAPITNRAAVAAATLLYDRLLHGESVVNTYTAIAALVDALEEGRTRLALHSGDKDRAQYPLSVMPRLAAKLADEGQYLTTRVGRVRIGYVGCPPSTHQVCFFTDDPSFLGAEDEEEEDPTNDMAEVVRDVVRGGEMWTEEIWELEGDCRVAACGITSGGMTFSASGMLSDLLESYMASVPAPPEYVEGVVRVAAFLRKNIGAGLEDWTPPGRRGGGRARRTGGGHLMKSPKISGATRGGPSRPSSQGRHDR